jgi:phenylpropionate dioxygenase-like ring-hydroxylating dioxygenase large terminal subunit
MVTTNRSFRDLVQADKGVMSTEIFTDPDIYAQELEQIFMRTWLFVGHESQIPKPGDYILSRMGSEPVIVTRDRQGKVNVMLNACRHRGNKVCRYDSGNAFGFQCTFHGWVYDSTGALVTLPKVDGGYDEMPKEEWGLMRARVELFQGSIWATWDQTAPSFKDYCGGAEEYLKFGFLDSDGSDDGSEVIGLMKWRIGMNWKVPMPDNDSTHGWITHRSLVLAMSASPSGSRVQQRLDPSDLSGPRNIMQVAFPEGHTTAIRVPRDGDHDEQWQTTASMTTSRSSKST